VATRTLPAGYVIGPGDVGTAKIALPPSSRSTAFGQPGVLVGRALAVTVQPGELLQTSMLVPVRAQPATRPVSVAVVPASLAGLHAGQSVDVLATGGTASAGGGSSSASGASSTTGGGSGVSLVARGATLISIDRASSNLLSGPSSALVTLGVSSLREVEAVVQAAQSGSVTLVAAEPSDGVGPGPGSTGS
jgi:hypothetical protein